MSKATLKMSIIATTIAFALSSKAYCAFTQEYVPLTKALAATSYTVHNTRNPGYYLQSPDGKVLVRVFIQRGGGFITDGRATLKQPIFVGEVGFSAVWFDHGKRLALRDRGASIVIEFNPLRVSGPYKDLWVVGQCLSGDITLRGTWPDYETEQKEPLRLYINGVYKRRLASNEVIVAANKNSNSVIYGKYVSNKSLDVLYQYSSSWKLGSERVNIATVNSDLIPPSFLLSDIKNKRFIAGVGHDRWTGCSLYGIRKQKAARLGESKGTKYYRLGNSQRWRRYDGEEDVWNEAWEFPILLRGDIVMKSDNVLFNVSKGRMYVLPFTMESLRNDLATGDIVVDVDANTTVRLKFR